MGRFDPYYTLAKAFFFRLLRVAVAGVVSAGLAFAAEQLTLINTDSDTQLLTFVTIATAVLAAAAKWFREKGILPVKAPI